MSWPFRDGSFGGFNAGGIAVSKEVVVDLRLDVFHHSTNLKRKMEPGITYCKLSRP